MVRPHIDQRSTTLIDKLTHRLVRPPSGRADQWHPAMQRRDPAGHRPLMLALYADGIRYTRSDRTGKSDSLLLVTMHTLASRRRHPLAVIRKSEMCRCGCRGWCTIFTPWSGVRRPPPSAVSRVNIASDVCNVHDGACLVTACKGRRARPWTCNEVAHGNLPVPHYWGVRISIDALLALVCCRMPRRKSATMPPRRV
eukprot:8087329-Pyramimonas_sp.AAC.1